MANLKSNWDPLFWEYLFVYMVQCHTLTRTEYVRFFYYRDFWCTLFFHPNTTTLYLMISCKGELRNGTKYAELAYLLPISRNSGVQKQMDYQETTEWVIYGVNSKTS